MLQEREQKASVFAGFMTSPKLSPVFLLPERNTQKMFLFRLENTARKKWKIICLFRLSKCKLSLLAGSSCGRVEL